MSGSNTCPRIQGATDATVYIVWLQRPGEAIQNIGALTLTDNLEGNLNTETALPPVHHHHHPEPNRQVEQPTHEPVFKSRSPATASPKPWSP